MDLPDSPPPTASAPPRAVTGRLALLLARADKEIQARAAPQLAELELTGRQYHALAVLAEDRPASQLELATALGVLPAIVVTLVDDLEGRGLLRRQRDPRDRRRQSLTLTDQGHALLRRADTLAAAVEDDVLAGIGAAARADLRVALAAALAPPTA
ncbi:MarR family transcriptional regulator [Streptomyces sp. SS7]|jgi:DNA-binding MarR family transcriptional regulator|uniref:MarR family winged helix-turn-helix transcriptional regulator n=1 Tax=Streptomyces sp. SS7 TaxID=3108485 RepID=UPI0030EB593B